MTLANCEELSCWQLNEVLSANNLCSFGTKMGSVCSDCLCLHRAIHLLHLNRKTLLINVFFYAIICRYLQVVPNNSDDDSLLTELLKLLDVILTVSSQPPEPVVAWVARTVLKRDGPQMTLLRNVQTNSNDSTVSESKR